MSTANKFDDLLTHLGTGPWNILYFIGSSYWSLLLPPQFLSGIYLAPTVNYTCLPPQGNESVVAISEDSCSYTEVTDEGTEVEGVCTEWDFDTSIFSSTLTSEFFLVCDRSYLRPIYQSIYMVGTFLSPLLSGYLADRFGRKIVIAVTQVLTSIFSIGLIFFSNFTAILVIRFFLGTFSMLTFYILGLEVCEPKHRGTVGILTGLPWALGTMAWGGLAYCIRDWRYLQLAASLPNLLILILIYVMDESPRWLIVNGHHDWAMQVLRKAARWNGKTLQPESELRILMRDIQEESTVCRNTHKDLETKKKIKFSLPNLLSTRPIQIITAVICVDYFAVSFMFDGINMSGDIFNVDPFLYLVLNGLMEVPGYTLTAPIIDRWGRRMPTVLSYVLSGVFIVVVAFIPSDQSVVIFSLVMTGKVLISGAYQIIYVYSSELFPTEVRLQGIGASSVAAQLASTLVPYITSLLGPVLPWLPSLVFGLVALVAGLATLALRESKDVALPDTIADLFSPTSTHTTKLSGHLVSDPGNECSKDEILMETKTGIIASLPSPN